GDDVAIAPIALEEAKYKAIPITPQMFVTPEDIRWFAPGTDTMMIGRFITHEGRQRNTPAVRFGNVSMLPFEPVRTERGGLKQRSFLVEERSLSGFSGSAVFVYHTFPDFERGVVR